MHEPRSLFGALDHSREGSVDPTSFWDKTLRGVSGGVGGVRLVAETAAHETNALLGTTSQGQAHGTDDETLEMYFADGKRRAERKLRLVRHPSSEGEVAHFDDDGVDDGALPTEENAYAPRLPPRDTFAPPPESTGSTPNPWWTSPRCETRRVKLNRVTKTTKTSMNRETPKTRARRNTSRFRRSTPLNRILFRVIPGRLGFPSPCRK